VSRDDAGLVVVGASLAGLRAVEAARAAGYGGRVTLVGAEPHLPYDRPPLSKAFLHPGAEPRYFVPEDDLRDRLGVDLRLGAPATALDPATRSVVIGADGADDVPYAALVIATGSAPRGLPGCRDLPGVETLRTLDDAHRIRRALLDGARVVVVGAGFIGSEVASSARALGNEVTVVEAAPAPLVRAAGPVVGAALARLHLRHGTDLRLGVGVTAVRGEGRVETVELSDGSVVPADLVVVGIGSAPATGWLAGSGVELAPDGGVVCDEYLAASVPGVHAAGDVAHWPNEGVGVGGGEAGTVVVGGLTRLENWTGAAEQGASAARNALAGLASGAVGERQPYATVPYVWSDWYDSRVQFVGHPAADEVRVVSGDLDERRFVALYRSGDRLAGAVTLNEPGKVMKYRRLIQRGADWQAALDLYAAPAA
jgi:NADPH-dependent 2,4-dienoyl-CoA reductase/sulfur reductase-like enzyme